jgi:hypothetical protein
MDYKYIPLKIIGRGSYGTAYLVENTYDKVRINLNKES